MRLLFLRGLRNKYAKTRRRCHRGVVSANSISREHNILIFIFFGLLQLLLALALCLVVEVLFKLDLHSLRLSKSLGLTYYCKTSFPLTSYLLYNLIADTPCCYSRLTISLYFSLAVHHASSHLCNHRLPPYRAQA